MVAVAPAAVGSRSPRVRFVPFADLESRGKDAIEAAARCGLVLDDWQKDVLVDSCRVGADGRWAAFEVGLCVPRQNGKGGVLEARELAGLFYWGQRLIIHSAHEFATSLEAFHRMLSLVESCPEFEAQVKRVTKSHGDEGIELKSGQRIRYKTRTKGSGKGFSCDLIVFDEAMFVAQFAHGALLPTLSAQENPQVWYAGSAVDDAIHDHGLVFSRVRKRAVEERRSSMAYFEWSLDYDNPSLVPDDVAADHSAIAAANPALGIRIQPEYVTAEQDSLDARSFAVERLGVGAWPDPDGMLSSVIPIDSWMALVDIDGEITGPICVGFDVSPERSMAIAVAGRRADGRIQVEIPDHDRDTRHLVPRLLELSERYPTSIVCAYSGPVASMQIPLREAGVSFEQLKDPEHGQACGALLDMIAEDQLRHLDDDALRSALKGARTRPMGDAWAWSRKSSTVDISPLVAATLAAWAVWRTPADVEVTIY